MSVELLNVDGYRSQTRLLAQQQHLHVYAVAVTPSSSHVFAASVFGNVAVWPTSSQSADGSSAVTPLVVFQATKDAAPVLDLCAGQLHQPFLLTLAHNELSLWNYSDSALDSCRPPTLQQSAAVVDATCMLLLSNSIVTVGSKDGRLATFDLLQLQLLQNIPAHSNHIHCFAAYGEQQFLTGSDDGLIKVWDGRERTAVKHFQPILSGSSTAKGIHALAVSPETQLIAFGGQMPLSLLHLSTHCVLASMPTDHLVRDCCFLPGGTVASAGGGSDIYVHQFSGQLQKRISSHMSTVNALSFVPWGSTQNNVLIAAGSSDTLDVFSAPGFLFQVQSLHFRLASHCHQ